MKYGRLHRRRGVSEVVGAMMLIIVVVAAVASLSYFLAAAQQQAQKRQTYLTNIHNDNLETVYAQFSPNDPTIQWELDSLSSSTSCTPSGSGLPVSWYVQQDITNSAQVELIPNQSSVIGNSTSGTISTVLQDSTAVWGTNQWVGDVLEYTSGPATGLTQAITSNTATSITTGAFSTAPDASGDTFMISPSSPVLPLAVTLAGGAYNAISKGVKVLLSTIPPVTITFASGTPNCIFEPATWNSITLTVRNTNTQSSSITGVEANNVFVTTWYEVDQSGHVLQTLNATGPLPMPARASLNIMLNRTGLGSATLAKNDSLTIVLQSGSGNFFTRTFSFPTALQRSSISTLNSGATSRDIVSFDGSQSFATNSSIQSYEWKLDIPNAAYATAHGCTSASVAAFSSTTNYDTAYASGQTLQYAPESLFPSHLGGCVIGPIRATLLVADTNGFTATSQPIIIAPDSNIDPVGSISAAKGVPACGATCTVTVTVTVDDIFGNPVNGVVVNAIQGFGNASPSPVAVATSGAGQAAFTVTYPNPGGSGTVNFQTGNLLPAQVAFP